MTIELEKPVVYVDHDGREFDAIVNAVNDDGTVGLNVSGGDAGPWTVVNVPFESEQPGAHWKYYADDPDADAKVETPAPIAKKDDARPTRKPKSKAKA